MLEISKQRVVKRGCIYISEYGVEPFELVYRKYSFRVQSELPPPPPPFLYDEKAGNQVKNGPVSPSNDLSKALENTRGESARDACISLEFIDDPVALTPSLQPLPSPNPSSTMPGPLDRPLLRFRMKDFAGNSATINARSRIDLTSTLC